MRRHNPNQLAILALIGSCLLWSSGCAKKADQPPEPATSTSPQGPEQPLPLTVQPSLHPDAISVKEVVASYDDFEMITPEPVSTNPELSRLCTGVRVSQLKEAEKKHGSHAFARISISMNALAAEAFEKQADEYPDGAVIVKSKHLGWLWDGTGNRSFPYQKNNPHPQSAGVGGMIKRHPGYAPQSGDWEYFYFENKDLIEHGLIQSCVQCHREAKSSDYVFGSWNQPVDGGY